MTLRRLAAVAGLCVGAFSIGGYFLFTNAGYDEPTAVDAIVVLGGDQDGRIDYALRLAAEGLTDTVVVSDPQGASDSREPSRCPEPSDKVRILCFVPDPLTTRGEAIYANQLSRENGWTHVMVITWRYHLPRAGYIFGQCFDGTTTMVPVALTYQYSIPRWLAEYAYQYVGYTKAFIQGRC
ncbi:YdcF family protein [Rhodococcus cerastii]|uniref:YdcF family protein n=1 Tax=Rhodococcus cerastii TaxID=908616 RepID=A0ABU4D424_9NOCA|nr:YdcF family protein [Rhodococcus cerastii]MDV6304435.1 YdcF family protein [Rhodococcus cerastii]